MMTAPVYPAATHFSLASGTRVLERFTIQRGLGTGGFGEVYFALSDAGKEVALKRIQRNLEIELRGVSHCLNLKHPHLVALYDVCRDESDHWWIVMEYIAGPSLRDCLDAAPTGLGEAETRRWFAAVAAGVGHLHQEGLVHRDLKPGNLFDDYGTVKVGDYGLSKYISESRRGGQTESVGTFHYMAPEIGRGEYGREIDLYALGVILYEMLTGRLPFDGETCQEIVIKHLSAEPDLRAIPEPYRQVIGKALQKDPRRRWTSAAEMAHVLGLSLSSHQPATPFTFVSAPPSSGAAIAPTTYGSSAAVAADPPIRATLAGQPAATGTTNGPLQPAAPAPLPVTTTAPPQEPIAQALSVCCQNLRGWWRDVQLSPLARAVLIGLGLFLLVRNLRWLLPLLTVIGMVYVPYYVMRQLLLVRHRRRTGSLRPVVPVAVPLAPLTPTAQRAARLPKRVARANWRQLKRSELAAKPASTQLAELTGSWLAAAISVVFCGVAAAVLGLRSSDPQPMLIAPYGWAMVTGLAVSLAILAMSKLWEAGEGDPLNRRFALAGAGGLLGALAYATANYLMLPLDLGMARSIDATELPHALYLHDGTPRLAALMAHFAILLAAVRWWKLADPLRSRRLSLWAVAVVVVADWLIHQFVPIPQPWGMLIAGTVVTAIQIAAPWEPSDGWKTAPALRQGAST